MKNQAYDIVASKRNSNRGIGCSMLNMSMFIQDTHSLDRRISIDVYIYNVLKIVVKVVKISKRRIYLKLTLYMRLDYF